MIKSVKRATEKLIGVRFIVSRPFHGLIESSPLAPTDVAQRFSAGFRDPNMIKSVKRTTEKLIGVRFIVSRPFHGLIESSPLAPTDESVGYCHPSASPTFAAKQRGGILSTVDSLSEAQAYDIEAALFFYIHFGRPGDERLRATIRPAVIRG